MGSRPAKILAAAALCLAAACAETMTTTTMIPGPILTEPSATPGTPYVAPATPITPSIEPMSELPDPFVATCMMEVARVANNGIVAPVSTTSGPLGETVVIAVGEERTPWECRVDSTGRASVSAQGAGPG
jgi:hypothetical protein